ncbi:hypothetical protein DFH07DRAFT_802799 [Mycena maculata]|uniref:DUF6535 domain-containing protein n=1 Tax=Mycena maculata TaxID=230809 RepID=A0AAD7JVE6_9AGAR|nr:hypothetical protein DFH07DRAFT_802799 [Mycena maculata]
MQRSSFQSPVTSRAPTPVASRYKQPRFAYQDSLEVPVSRSQSRARPGRTVDVSFGAPNRQGSPKSHVPTSDNTKVPAPGPSQARPEKDGMRDERGEETSDHARVWQIYTDEAQKADALMTDGWSRSIDVLLVFTGLFSAVLTTFIIQSYQLMLPDPADTTNALLAQLISLQFNNTTPTSAASAPQSTLGQIRWVNGLWFCALACSLSTALISMLAKQWLQAYLPNISGPPRQRARRRQARFMHLEAWHVPTIINALPLLLHVALLLFFAGLVVMLWSIDLPVTLATWVIFTFAYISYFASIFLPLLYPECPYQHPITDQLRMWFSPDPSAAPSYPRRRTSSEEAAKIVYDARACVPTSEDVVDATALAWLFNKSTDNEVAAAALQAIAGLPRDFSALRTLRDAGALPLIEQGFQSCFHKDTTVDLQWHLVDPESAELYCRAWMTLTRGTAEQWPFDIVEPLWVLQDLNTHPDAAAIASCAIALSSFDSHMSQWELLMYLARGSAGEVQLSQATQCCILDSISACFVKWEMPVAVIEDTATRAVPVLLRMLHLTEDLTNSKVRSAAALALYIVTCGEAVDLGVYMSEEKRRGEYCELMIEALSAIVEAPGRFGVQDALLDVVGLELARLASPIVAQSERFPQRLRTVARSSLSKLYADGRIAQGIVPDNILADVLHMLFPPAYLSITHQSVFVTTLVETLETSSHPGITNWAVRLLEVLLSRCSLAVSQAFVESNGINAVVRAARAGAVDSRRLQIDSLRTMCAFIASATNEYKAASTLHAALDSQFDVLLQSDFFDTLCSVVASRRWWLFEVSGHWLPAIVELSRIRPGAQVWRNVLKTFKEFADRNVGEDGYSETLAHLEVIRKVSANEEMTSPMLSAEVVGRTSSEDFSSKESQDG